MLVNAGAYQSTRQRAFERIATCHKCRVRAAVAHGHAKALGVAHHNVGIKLAWGFEQRQCQQISGYNQHGLFAVYHLGCSTQVVNAPASAGVLGQCSKVIVTCECGVPLFCRVDQLDGNAKWRGAGLNDLNGLRVRIA